MDHPTICCKGHPPLYEFARKRPQLAMLWNPTMAPGHEFYAARDLPTSVGALGAFLDGPSGIATETTAHMAPLRPAQYH